MKLIMESATLLNGQIEDELNEASGQTERNYYISGIFSTPDVKNRNGRVYSRAIWEKQVQDYQKEIKENTVNSLGEWQHPPRSTVDPLKSVLKIVELKINEDGNVWGRAKILNDNTEQTNKIKGLIKEGIKIGVSSRGVGKVSSTGMVESFKLITYDAVDAPSDYNAMLNGIVEGYQLVEGIVQDREYSIDENGCIAECSLDIPVKESLPLSKIAHEFDKKIKNSKAEDSTLLDKELSDLFKNKKITANEFNELEANIGRLNEENKYQNVGVLKHLLSEIDAEKLCDLSLDDKEMILTKFSESVIAYNEYKEGKKDTNENNKSKELLLVLEALKQAK